MKRDEIQHTLQHGARLYSPYFVLRVTHNNNNTPPMVGVIVSKKVSKKATIRNRCKRIIREALMSLIPLLHKGTLVVCVANPLIVSVSFLELKREMCTVLRKNSFVQ